MYARHHALSALQWYGPKGETTPRPKNQGDTKMASAFIGPSIGFGYNTTVTDDALSRINAIRRWRPIFMMSRSKYIPTKIRFILVWRPSPHRAAANQSKQLPCVLCVEKASTKLFSFVLSGHFHAERLTVPHTTTWLVQALLSPLNHKIIDSVNKALLGHFCWCCLDFSDRLSVAHPLTSQTAVVLRGTKERTPHVRRLLS
jgi:hypothetical protein